MILSRNPLAGASGSYRTDASIVRNSKRKRFKDRRGINFPESALIVRMIGDAPGSLMGGPKPWPLPFPIRQMSNSPCRSSTGLSVRTTGDATPPSRPPNSGMAASTISPPCSAAIPRPSDAARKISNDLPTETSRTLLPMSASEGRGAAQAGHREPTGPAVEFPCRLGGPYRG